MMRRTCRACGCTEERACIVGGVPCHWVEADLCSACDEAAGDDEALAPEDDEADDFCPASAVPAPHRPLWLNDNKGYCVRCKAEFFRAVAA
ncbi:MAG: hypothetical protein QOD40_568 [Alphaproteobacteria bacterium]|jgi:hypothetical protein|nr:hypothetical protein [Alphaproteobacteria bacterium]